tara:strand:+ start:640 stop:753 length:114 start_codon:yes stop_codon:yes gene_type:complete
LSPEMLQFNIEFGRLKFGKTIAAEVKEVPFCLTQAFL